MAVLSKMREMGKGVGGVWVGTGKGTGKSMRTPLSKLPFSKLPLSFSPKSVCKNLIIRARLQAGLCHSGVHLANFRMDGHSRNMEHLTQVERTVADLGEYHWGRKHYIHQKNWWEFI